MRLADESLGFLREGAFESWRSDLGLSYREAGARFWVVFHAAVLRHRPGRAGSVTAVVGNLEMLGFGFPVVIGAIADAHGLRVGLLCYAVVPAALLLVAGSVTGRAKA